MGCSASAQVPEQVLEPVAAPDGTSGHVNEERTPELTNGAVVEHLTAGDTNNNIPILGSDPSSFIVGVGSNANQVVHRVQRASVDQRSTSSSSGTMTTSGSRRASEEGPRSPAFAQYDRSRMSSDTINNHHNVQQLATSSVCSSPLSATRAYSRAALKLPMPEYTSVPDSPIRKPSVPSFALEVEQQQQAGSYIFRRQSAFSTATTLEEERNDACEMQNVSSTNI